MTLILFALHCFLFSFIFFVLLKADVSKLLKIKDYFWEPSSRGLKLYEQLLETDFARLKYSSNGELIRYKFFSYLIDDLLQSSKKYGTKIRVFLPGIKNGLLKEVQFSKKHNHIFLGGLYQIFFILFLGAIFLIMFKNEIGISLPWLDLIPAIILQVTGALIYIVCFALLKKVKFEKLYEYLKFFYKLQNFINAQSSLKIINNEFDLIKVSSKKEFNYYHKRIEVLLSNIKIKGEIDKSEIELYINEMWQSLEYKCDEFTRDLNMIKLLILCLFSLSGYLWVMYKAFSQLTP
jgi:hypothetical protein